MANVLIVAALWVTGCRSLVLNKTPLYGSGTSGGPGLEARARGAPLFSTDVDDDFEDDGITERHLFPRVMVRKHILFVDDCDSISDTLIEEVKPKATRTRTFLDKTVDFFGGQGGFIDLEKDDGMDTAPDEKICAQFVTANHNVAHSKEKYRFLLIIVSGAVPQESADALKYTTLGLALPTANKPLQLPSYEWEYGYDIDWRPWAQMVSKRNVFKLVREDFEYIAGQKVAMIVVTDHIEVNLDTVRGDSDTDVRKEYGAPGLTKIFTGEISFVGEQHIEHTINTAKGFSGAVIFLLDQNQPESVKVEDYGRAIAIHAGSPETDRVNVAFRLRGEAIPSPPKPLSQAESKTISRIFFRSYQK